MELSGFQALLVLKGSMERGVSLGGWERGVYQETMAFLGNSVKKVSRGYRGTKVPLVPLAEMVLMDQREQWESKEHKVLLDHQEQRCSGRFHAYI